VLHSKNLSLRGDRNNAIATGAAGIVTGGGARVTISSRAPRRRRSRHCKTQQASGDRVRYNRVRKT
jgi:hypothetical protein